ncbi:transcription initiation factor TFIID subunit 4-like [Acanthaster planci]|uniref:Transcription initiation factor TFIID subunit 4-like n=1 Tax=Acanthaster planci TaxID=133434 RepID=A0A8B7ZVH5_ACAPL|nr:transcription initiation factor TFIID subunit 4-like [Acanthaster planci]XP_022107526.1 transcription initiation factor TFIID subunit 4-like [Acanthaster planci]XP_022107527.1 transcription initiation factor TFIID subunit 4-like [Acanthaster planci]
MAGTTSIEDILSSVVDETAVSALIGSLESKLAAGNTAATSSSLDTAAVGSNHVSKPGATPGDVTENSTHPTASQINAGQDGPGTAAAVPTVVVTATLQQPSSGGDKAPDNLASIASGTAANAQNSKEQNPSTAPAVQESNNRPGNGIAINSAVANSSSAKPTPSAPSPTPPTCVRVITLPGGTALTTVSTAANISNISVVKSAVLDSKARTVVKLGSVQQQGQPVTQSGTALTTVTSSVLSSGSAPSTGISGQSQANSAQTIREHLTTGAKQPIKTAVVAPTPHQTASPVSAATTQPQIVLRPAPSLQVQTPSIKSNASSGSVVTLATTTVSQVKLSSVATSGQPNLIAASPQVQHVRLTSPQVIAPRTPGGGAVQFRLPQGTSLPPGVMLINKDGNIHAVVNSSIGPGSQIQHLPSGTVPGAVTFRQVQPGSPALQRPSSQSTSAVQSSIPVRPNVGQLLNTTNATVGQLKGGAQVMVGGSPVTFVSKADGPRSPVSISGQGVQAATPKMVGVSAGGTVAVTVSGVQRAVCVGGTPGVGQPVVVGAQPQPIPMSQSAMENVKKCRNFLTTLIKLASNGNQPAETVKNVKELVQNLIDGKTEPEEFTLKLQKELKSSPQPYLIPFLKKSLPLLRQTLQKGGSLQIQGLSAPTITAAQTMDSSSPATTGTLSSIAASQPTLVSTLATGPGKAPTLNLTPQQLQQLHLQQQQAAAKSKQQNMKVTQLQSFAQKSKPQTLTSSSSKSPTPSHSSSSRSSQSKSHSSKSSSSKSSSSSSSTSKKDKVKDHSSSGFKDDDDINDVTSMAGVNLSEESARILATNADFIGTQLRSIKEEKFLFSAPLQSKVNKICVKHGIQEASPDMMELVSHAAQERLKGLVEKLGVIAKHRMEIYRNDSRYEVTSDVRTQLKFFEQLDSLERKRRDEQERELLLRAAKSRSKQEDPEQARLKQKAKEMQQMELEQIRQQEANMTALAAIGPRKKRKVDSPTPGSSPGSGSSSLGMGGSSGSPSVTTQIRRIKRVNFRDLIFLMEQEQETKKSHVLFKMFLK